PASPLAWTRPGSRLRPRVAVGLDRSGMETRRDPRPGKLTATPAPERLVPPARPRRDDPRPRRPRPPRWASRAVPDARRSTPPAPPAWGGWGRGARRGWGWSRGG